MFTYILQSDKSYGTVSQQKLYFPKAQVQWHVFACKSIRPTTLSICAISKNKKMGKNKMNFALKIKQTNITYKDCKMIAMMGCYQKTSRFEWLFNKILFRNYVTAKLDIFWYFQGFSKVKIFSKESLKSSSPNHKRQKFQFSSIFVRSQTKNNKRFEIKNIKSNCTPIKSKIYWNKAQKTGQEKIHKHLIRLSCKFVMFNLWPKKPVTFNSFSILFLFSRW